MKRIFLLGILLISFSQINAQADATVGWVSKFGLAGGITPMWMFPDFSEVNKMLPNFGVGDFPSSGTFGLGGGGYAYIMLIDNLRIGGTGFSTSVERTSVDDGYRKKAVYSQGVGAFTMEYTFPFIKHVAVSVGAMIGGGSMRLELYRDNGSYSWDGVWDEISEPGSKTENISRKMSRSYFTIAPTLNLDIPLNRFVAIRLGGGYLVTFGKNWKMENGESLNNVPSGLNGNTFFIQTGLFLGFFAF